MGKFKRLLLQLVLFFLLLPIASSFAGDRDEMEERLLYAIRVIQNQYGDKVSFSDKSKTIIKFGRNNLVSTSAATVMTLPAGELNETYVSTNVINKFSSSNDNDDQEWKVEGHTCTGGLPTLFVVQTITLAGQTESPLTTALCRVTRAYNNDSTVSAGAIYFYEDDTVSSGVPQTAAKIHLTVPTGEQRSQKAATAFEATVYGVCIEAYGSIIEKATSYADFKLQTRLAGGVFQEQIQFAVSDSSPYTHVELHIPVIVPPSSDVRLVATADNASTVVSGGFTCYLAKVQP